MKFVKCAVAVSLLATAGAAQAQMARRFVATAPAWTPNLTKEDRDLVQAFAGESLKVSATGEVPGCMWRSPLETAGGFADMQFESSLLAGGTGYSFHMSIPFPADSTSYQGIDRVMNPKFIQSVYVEISGIVYPATDKMEWKDVRIVVPPLTGVGSRYNPLSHGEIFVGTTRLSSPFTGGYLSTVAIPAGLPRAFRLYGVSDPMMEALKTNSQLKFLAYAGRPNGGSANVAAELRLPKLSQDLQLIRKQAKKMQNMPNCFVTYSSDCADGRCG